MTVVDFKNGKLVLSYEDVKHEPEKLDELLLTLKEKNVKFTVETIEGKPVINYHSWCDK